MSLAQNIEPEQKWEGATLVIHKYRNAFAQAFAWFSMALGTGVIIGLITWISSPPLTFASLVSVEAIFIVLSGGLGIAAGIAIFIRILLNPHFNNSLVATTLDTNELDTSGVQSAITTGAEMAPVAMATGVVPFYGKSPEWMEKGLLQTTQSGLRGFLNYPWNDIADPRRIAATTVGISIQRRVFSAPFGKSGLEIKFKNPEDAARFLLAMQTGMKKAKKLEAKNEEA